MPSRKKLIEIEVITDTETGDYHVGEIDFGITCELDNHLVKYGRKGKEEIVKTLSYMIYEVERRCRVIESQDPKFNTACGEQKPG